MRKKPLVLGINIVEQLVPADRLDLGFLNIGPPVEVIMASNQITITGSFHSVYTTEGNFIFPAQLTNIIGGQIGDIIVLTRASSGNNISVRSTGNIRLDSNFTMNSDLDTLILLKLNTVWVELSRSNND